MNISSLLIILIFTTAVAIVLARDFKKGFFFALFSFVLLPNYLKFELPGSFPDLTVHRALLVTVLLFWLFRPRSLRTHSRIPFRGLLVIFCFAGLLSLLGSPNFVVSLKAYLSFTIEVFLFYLVAATTLQSYEDCWCAVRTLCGALASVAVLAAIEKYLYIRADAFVPGYIRMGEMEGAIMATYPHRILLGTAMAMGLPLALIVTMDTTPRRRFWGWMATLLISSACYFSMSRGPWLAGALVVVGLFSLGDQRMRWRLVVIGVLVMCTLVARPGVWHTVRGLSESTFDSSTLKGSSYQYRWELWRKAYTEVTKSPKRILIGYGQGSSRELDLQGVTSYSGKVSAFVSWDNQYALYLFELGFVGFGIALLLYGTVTWRLLIAGFRCESQNRFFMVGVLASVGVIIFMMTNVAIFAPQLDYAFWTLVAVGANSREFSQRGRQSRLGHGCRGASVPDVISGADPGSGDSCRAEARAPRRRFAVRPRTSPRGFFERLPDRPR